MVTDSHSIMTRGINDASDRMWNVFKKYRTDGHKGFVSNKSHTNYVFADLIMQSRRIFTPIKSESTKYVLTKVCWMYHHHGITECIVTDITLKMS